MGTGGLQPLLRGFLLLVIITLVATACGGTSVSGGRDAAQEVGRTTMTTSAEFGTAQERIEFASRYLTFAGPVDDVHFDINYIDNSVGRVPGPSDWDMRFLIVVDPETTSVWSSDHAAVEPFDTAWADLLLDRHLSDLGDVEPGDPEHFERSGSQLVVYADAGLIVRHASTS